MTMVIMMLLVLMTMVNCEVANWSKQPANKKIDRSSKCSPIIDVDDSDGDAVDNHSCKNQQPSL